MKESELPPVANVAEDAPQEETPGGNTASADDVSHTQLYNWFGIQQPDQKTDHYIKEIYDYAKSKTDGEWHNVLWYVRDIENKMKAPRFGESRYMNLYTYVKLMAERDHKDKEIASFEQL